MEKPDLNQLAFSLVLASQIKGNVAIPICILLLLFFTTGQTTKGILFSLALSFR